MAKAHPHGKDIVQKALFKKFPRAVLRLLGFSSEIAGSAKEIGTELFKPPLSIRRPDIMFVTEDDDVVRLLEFKSSAGKHDIDKAVEYASLAAMDCSPVKNRVVPSYIMIVYSGGCGSRPEGVFPAGDLKGAGYLRLDAVQVFLDDRLDFARIAETACGRVNGQAQGAARRALSDVVRVLLYSGPLGLVPAEPLGTTEKYLESGRKLALRYLDPDILYNMLLAVVARGNIATEALIAKYMEVLEKMGYDTASFVDGVTGGRYSALLQENESKDGTIKFLEGEVKSKDGAIKYLEGKVKSKDVKIKSKDGKIKSKDGKIKSLRTKYTDAIAVAVRAMRKSDMSPEEISAELKIGLSEVLRILGNGGV
ncbi:MAG: hypothetical protein LBQ12_01985 [Deltaproteobacteria bacterium]|nr:hypothetical protein [Deltaproteobacteria bacterium]